MEEYICSEVTLTNARENNLRGGWGELRIASPPSITNLGFYGGAQNVGDFHGDENFVPGNNSAN
jgi:hypothetical protein